MNPDEVIQLWKDQNGLCALCKINEIDMIDHRPDTEPKEVRGGLCSRCNTHIIGGIETGIKDGLLERALDYINKPGRIYNNKVIKPNYARGERNNKSKLTNKQRREICDLYSTGKYTHEQLAKDYGMSRPGITYILATWKEN